MLHFLVFKLIKLIDCLINHRKQMFAADMTDFSLWSPSLPEKSLWEDLSPQLQGSPSVKPVMKPASPCCKEPPTTQKYFIILGSGRVVLWRTKCCFTGFSTLTRRKFWHCTQMFFYFPVSESESRSICFCYEAKIAMKWKEQLFIVLQDCVVWNVFAFLSLAFHRYTLHSSLFCVLTDPCF